MNYGINENAKHNSMSTVEYHTVGADGNTYGIIKECNKFYIKVAPKKDTKIVAEDYDYIGGFMNKKDNEYSTYPMASKQFDLKMKSLNEEYGRKYDQKQFKPIENAEWQVNETKEMRSEIDRYNEIVNNVGNILKEGNEFTMKHTLPEAPASNPSSQKVNSPFTDTAIANGDKDFKKTETNYEKAGGPYKEDGTVSDSDMQSDKNPKGKNSEAYSEKAKYVPDNSVADKKPSGAKSVKMNEGKRTVKLTEEQVLAWSKSKDFMDKSNGTEIGDSAPFTENAECEKSSCKENQLEESEAVHNSDATNMSNPGCGEVGDDAPFTNTVTEDIVDVDDAAGMPDDVPFPEVEDDDYTSADLDFEDEYNQWLDNQDNQDDTEFELDFNEDDMLALPDDELDLESVNHRKKMSEGIVLNDFGKHPAYRKVPMTTPPNKEVSKSGRDWNDDSAKGEQPFGNKIGNSAPFTDEVIDMITDNIMKRINKKKV